MVWKLSNSIGARRTVQLKFGKMSRDLLRFWLVFGWIFMKSRVLFFSNSCQKTMAIGKNIHFWINCSKTYEGVPESLWKPHQSKVHKISDRYNMSKKISTPKKNYFFRPWKKKSKMFGVKKNKIVEKYFCSQFRCRKSIAFDCAGSRHLKVTPSKLAQDWSSKLWILARFGIKIVCFFFRNWKKTVPRISWKSTQNQCKSPDIFPNFR